MYLRDSSLEGKYYQFYGTHDFKNSNQGKDRLMVFKEVFFLGNIDPYLIRDAIGNKII